MYGIQCTVDIYTEYSVQWTYTRKPVYSVHIHGIRIGILAHHVSINYKRNKKLIKQLEAKPDK